MDPFTAFFTFILSGTSVAANVLRFVATTLITTALRGTQNGPQLNDLKVQNADFGKFLARLFGQRIRVTGNLIDHSDILEQKWRRGGFGRRSNVPGSLGGERFFGLGRTNVYTYRAQLVIGICEGPLPAEALKKIYANGRLIFDADGGAPILTDAHGQLWGADMGCYDQSDISGTVRFYRGDATQPVDDDVQDLHPGLTVPAYRHTAYVVIGDLQLAGYGNGIPNIEIEVEPDVSRLGDVVHALASYADVDVYDNNLDDTVRGFAVAGGGTAWQFIEPLAAAFSFDLIKKGTRFEGIKRGSFLRTVIPVGELAAVPSSGSPEDTKSVEQDDPITYPDTVNITYMDPERDYQLNTQTISRNVSYAQNIINVDLALVMTADEAAQLTEVTLYSQLGQVRGNKFTVSNRYRWLDAGDYVGIDMGNNIEVFRLISVSKSPNTVIEIESLNDDPLAYRSTATGAIGIGATQALTLQGDTILQWIDSPLVADTDDDTGNYVALAGDQSGWLGSELYRSTAGIAPADSTYEYQGAIVVPSIMANCVTVLPDHVFDVWDRVSTLTIDIIGQEAPTTASEDDVLVKGFNLAWVGSKGGHDGEFIHFATVTATVTPGRYILSNLLRGRHGTEYAIPSHAAAERFVLFASDTYGRLDFGPADWNVARAYKAASTRQPLDHVTEQDFTSTGEGKRPLSPVLPRGERNVGNDITINWVRRTRLQTPQLGGGAVPLGEGSEAYEVDVLTAPGGTVLRTLSAGAPVPGVERPSVTYTSAQQTADGKTPGALVDVVIYQLSDIRGRGHPAISKV